jgi:polysaccharide biosynthesis/export protein
MRKMTNSPLHRCIAVLLVAQPVFWMGSVAYAQSVRDPGSLDGGTAADPTGGGNAGEVSGAAPGATATSPDPFASRPRDVEAMRGDRGLLSGAGTAFPALDETIDPDRYVCGPGDILELNFWGVQNFKLRVTIDVEGRAFVSKVGYFKLQGKTLTQARRVMRDSVARLYRLNFDVTLSEPRTFLVQVVDAVPHPGSYPARAIERVAAVILRAGGFGTGASKRRVEVHRRDGSTVTADLLLYAQTGDLKHNPYLLDGDVVRVPFVELAAVIAGAVNRPGRYELVKTRDLAELVELSGGLSPLATQRLPVTVVRRAENDRQDLKLYEYAAGKLPAIVLQPEDAVRIPAVGELQQSVAVVGAVAGAVPPAVATVRTGATPAPDEASATRRLPFVEGDTVRTLLERVGGVGPLADLTGSYLLRGGQSIPIDLYALVMVRDLRADLPIELGDTLVIPFKRRNILVEGAVLAPGSYPHHPGFGIEQYLSLAGGRSRNAQSLDSVKLITPNGETKDFKPDLKIEPGSSLVVAERNFSRSEVVQIVISAAGVILSGVAVVIAARR